LLRSGHVCGTQMKLRFFHKLLGLSLGVALAVLIVSTLTFVLSVEDVLVQGLGNEAIESALLAVGDLPSSELEAVLVGDSERSEAWDNLIRGLSDIQAELGPSGVENVYLMALRDGVLYTVGDPTGDDPPFVVEDTVYVVLKTRVLETGTAEFTPSPYTDEYGSWISGYVPVRAEDGGTLAVLGADLPVGAFPLATSIVGRTLALRRRK